MKKSSLAKSALLIVTLSVFNFYLPAILFVEKYPVNAYWMDIIGRALSLLVSFLLVRAFYPSALTRFGKPRLDRKSLPWLFFIVTFFVIPSIQAIPSHAGALEMLMNFVATLGIGFDEESFSRGLIFASLEKYGARNAAIVSSLHFGSLHYLNVGLGHQTFAVTTSQVLSAAAFGYLMCALMLVTGSIWVGVVMHGLSDYSMVWMTNSDWASLGHASFDWSGTLVYCLFYISAAEILMRIHKQDFTAPDFKWARKLGLVKP